MITQLDIDKKGMGREINLLVKFPPTKQYYINKENNLIESDLSYPLRYLRVNLNLEDEKVLKQGHGTCLKVRISEPNTFGL